MRLSVNLIASCLFLASAAVADESWQPAKGPLATRWTAEVSPQNALAEYPRPQMVRSQWKSLNGLWDYAVRPKDESRPEKFDGKILVPFPIESALSGVMAKVGDANRLWYHSSFNGRRNGKTSEPCCTWAPSTGKQGARQRQASGRTSRRYTSDRFDITDAVNPTGQQELVVSVWTRPTPAHSRAANRWRGPTAFGTRRSRAFGKPCGSSRSPSFDRSLLLVPDLDAGVLK